MGKRRGLRSGQSCTRGFSEHRGHEWAALGGRAGVGVGWGRHSQRLVEKVAFYSKACRLGVELAWKNREEECLG